MAESDIVKIAATVLATSLFYLVLLSVAFLWLACKNREKENVPASTCESKQRKSLTFRITNIPSTISSKQFESLLINICNDAAFAKTLVLGWSFARSSVASSYTTATATFNGSPDPLQIQSTLRFRIQNSDRLRVDLDFFGLTVLANPERSIVDIIAVTGLSGHAFGSWRSRDGQHMWLRDFLPESVPDARILTYGYDTKLPGSQSTTSAIDLARTFLESLVSARTVKERQRPIIFIAHSLGGLVVKQAILQAAKSTSESRNIYDYCAAVVFFGVPNRGLEIGSLEAMVKGQPNEQLMRDLGVHSTYLRLLHESFESTFHDTSRILSFYETKQSPTVEWSSQLGTWTRTGSTIMMVPRISATHSGRHELPQDQLSIEEDHSGMVKFSSISDQHYSIVEGRLKQLVQQATIIVAKRYQSFKKEFNEAQTSFLKSLAAPDYVAFRKHRIDNPARGTLRWILCESLFNNWARSYDSRLWIRGSPGQGKTVLTKFILNYLENQNISTRVSSTSLYFFFYEQDNRFNSVASLLRSFIKQLIISSAGLSERSRAYFDTNPSTEFDDELWSLFRELLRNSGLHTVYVLIDALDECQDVDTRRTLLRWLKDLMKIATKDTSFPRIHVLVTSRPTVDLSRDLQSYQCLELTAKDGDLDRLVTDKLQSMSLNSTLQNHAKELLLQGAGRTFLWVAIVLKQLGTITLPTANKLHEIIMNTPKSLEDMYRSLIERILEGPEEEQKLLVWIVYAKRPLTLLELETALATQPNSASQAANEPYRAVLSKEELIASAAGVMLEITGDERVRLVHQSAKDFLLNAGSLCTAQFLKGIHPQSYLANVCMTYLRFEDFRDGPCKDEERLANRKKNYPLLQYAARNWHSHVRSGGKIIEFSDKISQLVKPHSTHLLVWAEAAGVCELITANNVIDIATQANIDWLVSFKSQTTVVTRSTVLKLSQSVSGYNVMGRLLEESSIEPAENVMEAIVQNFDESLVRFLMKRYNFRVSDGLLKAAISNRLYAISILRLLLPRANDICLSKTMMTAISSSSERLQLLEMILRHENISLTDHAILEITTRYGNRYLQLVPESHELVLTETLVRSLVKRHKMISRCILDCASSSDSEIDDEIIASQRNEIGGYFVPWRGVKSYASINYEAGYLTPLERILFDWHDTSLLPAWNDFGSRSPTNYNAIAAYLMRDPRASYVVHSVGETLQGFLERRPRIESSGRILEYIAGYFNFEIFSMFFSQCRENLVLTESAMTAVFEAPWAPAALDIFLEQYGDKVPISEAIIITAVGTCWGHKLLKSLLDHRGSEVHITESIFKRAISGPKTGDELLIGDEESKFQGLAEKASMSMTKLLLNRRGSEIKITTAIVEAALRHTYPTVLEVLFQSRGKEVVITKNMMQPESLSIWEPRRFEETVLVCQRWKHLIKEDVLESMHLAKESPHYPPFERT